MEGWGWGGDWELGIGDWELGKEEMGLGWICWELGLLEFLVLD